MEKILWYGKIIDGKIYLFKNLRENYMAIFRDLRNGRIPETEEIPSGEVPDLRDFLLDFERERLKDEFSGDQYLIKLYSIKKEINEIINLYLEKLIPFFQMLDVKYSKDPCTFFKSISGNEIENSLGSFGSSLCDFRTYLDDYIKKKMQDYMPNTMSLLGYDLTMEYLVRSGGLKNLVKYPASTLQILGAEKSFFRFYGTGKTPKHGIIFNYPGLASLPAKSRGKLARIICNKLAITLKMDYYKTGNNLNYKDLIDKKMAELKKLR
ncbi:Nop56p-related protein [Picrophilus oshimae DSM 9789]|uniref:Nop56p-related protein n=1 Tax=Picrophilus torridus (strain ATCC 700027 / DSM 9790 / JCM 10055 / NBRC 100828 / KAW 2/3) TaxID=1122961 RepID=Q6L199_PICTO|nr:Nop56p-related protein [Picrophilus oshimae DSM 9789]